MIFENIFHCSAGQYALLRTSIESDLCLYDTWPQELYIEVKSAHYIYTAVLTGTSVRSLRIYNTKAAHVCYIVRLLAINTGTEC